LGALEVPLDLPNVFEPAGLLGGDFDGDGATDLIVPSSGSADWYLVRSGSDGKLGATAFPAPLYYAGSDYGPDCSLGAADFDGDGRLDLFAYGQRSDGSTVQ